MSPAARPATVRFHFDADVLGLAKVLAPLHSDVTYPGDPGDVVHRRRRPACPIAPRAKDPEWIPVVAAAGWLIITRDRSIQNRPAEIEAVRANGAKLITLSSADAGTTWAQLKLVMTQWDAIEAKVDEPGPFIYAASRSRLRAVDLGA
jgi:PIN like domain